ncbi:hypothetical protein SAMN05428988_5730 [Chitinophaga sp. YR573]|uniref:hypothetical protein n=1 Tax=Chitinophaga sp. YR573 TaxID=1881040 RepID=UPI0008B4E31B|nr:hypothetical protein [Chitinophaga sp. YR573]SEW44258.1 hypothetical protein SAMN05428988_5730 [Chitinophaga sp. YR573]
MEAAKKDVNKQLKELRINQDLGGLDTLIQSLSTDDLRKYKTELVDTCLSMFAIWYSYLVCDKIREEDREGVTSDLLEILSSAEKIDPEKIHYEERAECYEYLSEIKNEKLHYIQKAIDEYNNALRNQGSVELNARLAHALLTRMLINQQFTDDEFIAVLQLFQLAFTAYSESVFRSFFYACFQILHFPFDRKHYWHAQFFDQLTASLSNFVKKDPVIYLTWSDELKRMLDHDISPAYADELNKRSIELLEPLTDYQTNDTSLLNSLGSAFDKAAQRMETGSLHYYQIALNYFIKGQSINPAAWTFPVYATNVQIAMARIYKQEHNQAKVIELFEAGKSIFLITYEYEKGLTLTLRWGEFLIEYARLAYNFDAPDLLKEAETRLLIAKELGENHYRTPYIALAKVALKTGDHQKCLDILRECKFVFTTQYYEYDFEDVLGDEDFKEVWEILFS